MIKNVQRGSITRALTVALASGLFLAFAASASLAVIEYSDDQRETIVELIEQLEERHYAKLTYDDELSSQHLDNYIDSLDGGKMFFTASDLAEFEQYRNVLDDQSHDGQLDAGYAIFNRFQARLEARLEKVLADLDGTVDAMDFTVDEVYVLNGEDRQWASNDAELDERWRKHLKNQALSLKLAEKPQDEIAPTLEKRGDGGEDVDDTLSGTQKTILVLFAITFIAMIWGVSSQGWWMAKMGALFLGAAIVIGLIGRLGEKRLTGAFVDGARDLLGVALVIGLARGIVVVMENGLIADTILNASAQTLGELSNVAFISSMFGIEVGMSFFVPSSSGLAVLSMPILAPLADFANVSRDLVVTAYQSANGLVNLINPTFAVVIGGLAIGRVSYDRWIVFIWPLLVILTVFIMGMLAVGAWMGGVA